MLAGPLFTREVLTAPRSIRHFVLRAGYVFALFVLMYTAGQATFGWRPASGVAELGRFGNQLFQMFSAVQLALVRATLSESRVQSYSFLEWAEASFLAAASM